LIVPERAGLLVLEIMKNKNIKILKPDQTSLSHGHWLIPDDKNYG